MKKIIALLLALVLCFSFAACKKGEAPKDDKTASDLSYIQDKGKIVIGITDFAPMDYKEKDSDEWIGFDADMAKAFAKSLGVEIEFVEIDWDNKAIELKNKSIDCVWNGMTITDEVKAVMDISNPYCNNAQVAVVKAADADKYKTVESLKGLNFAVEAGSAGEKEATAASLKTTPVDTQAKTLIEVKAGTCDAAVIDYLMAVVSVGEGTDYADLMYTATLNDGEEYGVGFRQGSDLVAVFNDFLKSSYKDGSMLEIANTYKIADRVIEQK